MSQMLKVRNRHTPIPETKLKPIIHKSEREFEGNIGIQSKSNPKMFWSHVRSKRKTKTGVAPLSQNKKDKTSQN